MRTSTSFILGLDLGTTYTKALVVDDSGKEIAIASVKSRWSGSRPGEAEGFADDFVDRALEAARIAMASASEKIGLEIRIGSVGITGLAESGVLVDAFGRPLTPVIAWFDERGDAQMKALPVSIKEEFSRQTGLIFTSQCSLGKWLWLRENMLSLNSSHRWLNLLEYLAFRLTGGMFFEPSLMSRTGAWSQSQERAWGPVLEVIGVSDDFFPEIRLAGSEFGRVSMVGAPGQIQGAVVTVAGHDHAVASVGAGALDDDVLFNSCGTADVLFRSVGRKLTDEERQQLVIGGIGSGSHVIQGRTALIGGTRAGLILRRILSMYGSESGNIIGEVDDAWSPDAKRGSVLVSEPQFMSNELTITLNDETTPQEIWNAALAHNMSETKKVLDHVNRVVGEQAAARAAGGWTRLRSVKLAKTSLMPGLSISTRLEPGAFGAAIFAAVAEQVGSAPAEKLTELVLDKAHQWKELE